jgi:nitrogen fixation NifU-like protein
VTSPPDDLTELYHEIILDHGRRPRNFREMAGSRARRAEGFNPLCGDRVVVSIDVEGGLVRDICFTGKACAICTASASMMTEHLKGKREEQARGLFREFQSMITGAANSAGEAASGEGGDFDRLNALAGVKRFPMRVKCATLPWHTMLAALEDRGEAVSTE